MASILIVTGSPPAGQESTAGDVLLEDVCVADGHTVTRIRDIDAAATTPSVYDLTIVSDSCTSEPLAPHVTAASGGWKASPKPFIVFEPGVYDEFALSSSVLATSNRIEAFVTQTAGALGGGIASGIVQIFTTSSSVRRVSNAAVGSGAISVLLPASGSAELLEFAYPAGGTLSDGTPAAGKRVAFTFFDAAVQYLNPDGRGLVSAAVAWSLDGQTPTVTAPTAAAGADVTAIGGEFTRLDGSASSKGSGADLTYLWEIVSGDGALTGATTARPVFACPSQTGQTIIRLTVSNGQQSAQDSVTVTISGTSTVSTPSVDGSTTGWNKEPAAAASFAAALSDGSDSSYAYTGSNPTGVVLVVRWTVPPPASASRVVFQVRQRVVGGSGSATLTVMQGATTIASRTVSQMETAFGWWQVELTSQERATLLADGVGPSIEVSVTAAA